MSPRTLVIDIETAPLEGYFWKIFDENISLNQITEDWCLLSYAAKWLGEKKVLYADTGGRGKAKVRDDRKIARDIHALLDEADIVVGHNAKKFDVKKINSRLLFHGIKPYSPFRMVDTYQVAKSKFGEASNKLEFLAKKFTKTPKDEHREFPGFHLWRACLQDNKRAWRQMRLYNPQDVISTENFYLEILPWITNHPNVAAYIEDKEPRCPKCGSKHLQARGRALTQQGSYPRWQCQGCGGWSRGKQQNFSHEVRKALLVGA